MQLESSHIKRLIDYVNSIYEQTKKLRRENITAENYRLYYDDYKEIKIFIAHLETTDTELQELFDAMPALPKPDSLLIVVNTFTCWLHTSTALFFSIFWFIVLLAFTAPISIPLFIYGQIKLKQLKKRLEIIEIKSAKLSFVLQFAESNCDKIITSSQKSEKRFY